MLVAVSERVRTVIEWLRAPIMRALLKASIFGVLLFQAEAHGYSIFTVALFAIWSIYIFITPVARRFSAPISFATLLALALLMPSRFTVVAPSVGHVLPEHVFAIVFAALCFLYIAFVSRVFGSPQRSYELLHAGLLWGTSLLFIAGQEAAHPIRALVIGAFLFWALTAEYLAIHGHTHRRMKRLAAIILTLTITEFTWALRLLPLSVGYTAALVALLGIIGTAALEQYGRGTLRARFVRLSVGVCLGAAGLIALLTRWVI